MVVLERQIKYVVEVVKKMERERLKSVEVKEEALNDFEEYLEVSVRRHSAYLVNLIAFFRFCFWIRSTISQM